MIQIRANISYRKREIRVGGDTTFLYKRPNAGTALFKFKVDSMEDFLDFKVSDKSVKLALSTGARVALRSLLTEILVHDLQTASEVQGMIHNMIEELKEE